jgi:hypothetical protein
VIALLVLLPAAALAPLPPGDGWRVVKQVDGFTARIAPSGTRVPWGAAEGLIEATPDEVMAHLTAFETLPRYVPKLERVQVMSRREGEAVVYFYFDLPWPVKNRDYTVHYRWQRDGDGHVRMFVEAANELGPPPGDAIRVGLLRAMWELSPAPGGRTFARYVVLADFAGSLTRSMLEQAAWRQPLETLRGVRKALAGRRAAHPGPALAPRAKPAPPPLAR